MPRLARYLPVLDWGRAYNGTALTNDLVAAGIVTIMLIPQSLAYAMLAGLPPEVGLYASILPIIAYAAIRYEPRARGRTRRGDFADDADRREQRCVARKRRVHSRGTRAGAAFGLFLLLMGVLKLGFLANLLSHPVVSGFITASGIIIATSQLKAIFGISGSGRSHARAGRNAAANLEQTNLPTLVIGVLSTAFLFWVRKGLKPLLTKAGLTCPSRRPCRQGRPDCGCCSIDLGRRAVRSRGAGRARRGRDPAEPAADHRPAVRCADCGSSSRYLRCSFPSSASSSRFRSHRRSPLRSANGSIRIRSSSVSGAANVAASFSGGYPVTGGFARSVVNFDAGAETPAAGAFTAAGIAVAALFLTPLLHSLPIATLAATIIVAVLSLVDLRTPQTIWRYSRADFAAMAATVVVTLLLGVEPGVIAGVGLSLGLHLWRTSRPHAAIVGRVPETGHFRNVNRHKVITDSRILTIRIDESLTYLNARWLEEFVLETVSDHPKVRHLVLMCSAVNSIDASALESLEAINHRLEDAGVRLHLSEVKGPVMDRLERSSLLEELTGRVFLSQDEAFSTLLQMAEDGPQPERDDPWIARGLI